MDLKDWTPAEIRYMLYVLNSHDKSRNSQAETELHAAMHAQVLAELPDSEPRQR